MGTMREMDVKKFDDLANFLRDVRETNRPRRLHGEILAVIEEIDTLGGNFETFVQRTSYDYRNALGKALVEANGGVIARPGRIFDELRRQRNILDRLRKEPVVRETTNGALKFCLAIGNNVL